MFELIKVELKLFLTNRKTMIVLCCMLALALYTVFNPHLNGVYAGYEQMRAQFPQLQQLAINDHQAWSKLALLWQGYYSEVVLTLFVLLIYTLMTQDRQHREIVGNYPITLGRYVVVKAIVACVGLVSLLLAQLPAFILQGLVTGFGNVYTEIPVYHQLANGQGAISLLTISSFLGGAYLYLILWAVVFMLVVWIMSLLWYSQYVNLLSIGLLYCQHLYMSQGDVLQGWLAYLPTNFVSVGQIVSGWAQYHNHTSSLSYANGLISLVITILLLFIILYGVTQLKFVKIAR